MSLIHALFVRHLSRSVAFLALLPLLIAADECGAVTGGGGLGDTGVADVTFQEEGGAAVRLVHSEELSDVSLTPPAEGVVELDYAYQDPGVTLRLRVDSVAVAEGDVVDLPQGGVQLTVDYEGVAYSSENAGAGGTVSLDTLQIDADTGTLSATIDATLTDDEGGTLIVSGSVEASG